MVHSTSKMGTISRNHKIGVHFRYGLIGQSKQTMSGEGVSGSSRSSAAMKVSGLELRVTSISTTSVDRSLQDSLECPMTFLRHLFTDHTSISKKPPHQGAFSKLKHHSFLRLVKKPPVQPS